MNPGLFFISQPEQVPFVKARLKGRDVPIIVALDYWVELDLKKQDIPFVSLADVATSPQGDRALLEHTRALALGWYTSPEMAFFKYDGIKLGEQHEVFLLYYIQEVVYWVAMLEQVLAAYPDAARVSVFETFVQVPPTADPTAAFRESAVV